MKMLYCFSEGGQVMSDRCDKCGCAKSQVVADAKTLGLQQEFEGGRYTCCQIAEWAQEQWSAWIEATRQDAEHADETTGDRDKETAEGILVPVRLRRPLPCFKNPEYGW